MAKAQAQEPSMEEILASIRRIIADEDTGASAASKLASVAAKTQPPASVSVAEDELDKLFDSNDDDVLELGESDKEPGIADADMDLSFEPAPVVKPQPAPRPAPELMPEPVAKAPVIPPRAVPAAENVAPDVRRQPEPQAARPEMSSSPIDSLLSQSTDSMVSAAFDNLALSILNKNARTVEDLIQDMLRPMLRSWLDQNLPSLVERLVRAEIERVARGR